VRDVLSQEISDFYLVIKSAKQICPISALFIPRGLSIQLNHSRAGAE
jgi:hypothetical protein